METHRVWYKYKKCFYFIEYSKTQELRLVFFYFCFFKITFKVLPNPFFIFFFFKKEPKSQSALLVVM